MTALLRHPLARLAEALLPPGAAVAGGPVAAWTGPIPPEEEQAVAQAVPRRRAEFAAGRRAARAALARLGLPCGPLPVRPDGPPLWPPGATGTITHGGDHVLAAVAPAAASGGLGLDLEPLVPLDADLAPSIRRPDEEGDLLALFSAKEAAGKAQFDRTRCRLDLLGLHIRWKGDGAFVAEAAGPAPPALHGLRIEGRQVRWAGLILSAAALPPRPSCPPMLPE